MVSSRELFRDAANFFFYFSLFLHVFILNLVYSKCPKSFQCGNLGNLEFPLADFSQPECGLFKVECNGLPYPRIHINIERISPPYEILSYMSTNQALIRDTVFESLLTSCDDFDIYYANSNESLPPPIPNVCSVLYLPIKSQPISDSDLPDRLGIDYNIEWNLSNGCIDCHREGGQCTADQNNGFRCVKAAGRSKLKLVFVAGASATANEALHGSISGATSDILSTLWFCKRYKQPFRINGSH
ncbi:unnamed protein product [Fraxinus pennsylvanica]|uniref:Uncharacterized protein n=1 Tax=Fraxinus pennsylvanica TaxID=56036 RepID=A0AAD2E670_9LAMI|nr:unnamed protein product [Fraxinus pennsylvanica]